MHAGSAHKIQVRQPHPPRRSTRAPSPRKPPNGHLLHFNYLGWIAVAFSLLSIVLARRVRVTDTGVAQPKPLIDPNHEAQVAG